MTLSDVQPNQTLAGVESGGVVQIIAVVPFGDVSNGGGAQIIYKRADGSLGDGLSRTPTRRR